MPATARPTTRRLTPAAAAALLALAAGATARPAEAQLLKRIKQAAQEKIAEAAVGRAGEQAGGGGEASAHASAHASTARAPLAITPERIDAFLTAMAPAVKRAEEWRAERAADSAYQVASKAADVRVKRWEGCVARIMQTPAVQAEMRTPAVQLKLAKASEEYARFAERVPEMMQQQVGDARRQAFMDSATVASFRMQAAAVPALRDCGDPPSRPVPPTKRPDAPPPGQLIALPEGMTKTQFGRLRERIAVYALDGGKRDPFTAEERAALDARAADLAKMTPLFRDGMLGWQSWGDIGRGWDAHEGAAQ